MSHVILGTEIGVSNQEWMKMKCTRTCKAMLTIYNYYLNKYSFMCAVVNSVQGPS